MVRSMMQGLLRLLPLAPLLQMSSLRKQTQPPSQQEVVFQRSPLRMNARPAHRHDQISHGAQQIKIDRPLGRLPTFLLAPRFLFPTFTLNVTSRHAALAVETHTSQGRSILLTVLVGLVMALATIAEAWTPEVLKGHLIGLPLIAMVTETASIPFAAEQSFSRVTGTETDHLWTFEVQT
jgi:hypothetical protein